MRYELALTYGQPVPDPDIHWSGDYPTRTDPEAVVWASPEGVETRPGVHTIAYTLHAPDPGISTVFTGAHAMIGHPVRLGPGEMQTPGIYPTRPTDRQQPMSWDADLYATEGNPFPHTQSVRTVPTNG